MSQVNEFEELTKNLIGNIISEKKNNFLDNGYTLDSDIERVTGESYYESEAYILLKHNEGVLELYPIQIVLAVKGEEPVPYVNEENLTHLEEELRIEISRWEKKYLSSS